MLRCGGDAIVVNESVQGYLKNLGSRRHHDRSESIHEEKVRAWQYRRAAAHAGFPAKAFMPSYFVTSVTGAKIHPETRFHGIALALSAVGRRSPRPVEKVMALGLAPAQHPLGFPFNAVLSKRP
ncbi:MAG: hypothetical protein ACRD0Z_15645 [Acidimicrobiales bacterium]